MKTTVNSGKRTALFWFLSATFLVSFMAHGAGAAKFGTLRNPDWVVTNAWIAASNRVDSFVSNNIISSISRFSETGTIYRSSSLGNDKRWIDSTGCVWQIVGDLTNLVDMLALKSDITDSISLEPATNYANTIARDATNYTDDVVSAFALTNQVLMAGPYLSATGGIVSGTVTVEGKALIDEIAPGHVTIGRDGVSLRIGTYPFTTTARASWPFGNGTIALDRDIIRATNALAQAATSYTDDATNALAQALGPGGGGSGGPAARLDDGTNIVTAAREVFEVVQTNRFSDWTWTSEPESGVGISNIRWEPWAEPDTYILFFDAVTDSGHGGPDYSVTGPGNSTTRYYVGDFGDSDVGIGWTITFRRSIVPVTETNYVGRLALTNDIPEISTNNAAFVAAVLAAPIVGASQSDLADIAEYGSYGTVGAAILALIAGLAALKRDKASKADLPYPFVPIVVEQGVATVSPRTVATFTAGSSAAAFTVAVGTGTTGAARDCVLVVDCTAAGAVAPTVTWPSNFHPRTDAATDLAIVEAGKRAVFYISEYAAGEFAVGGWVETEGGSGT